MTRRAYCLELAAQVYREWPSPKAGYHVAASHYGYSWNLNDQWELVCDETGDVITQADVRDHENAADSFTEEELREALIYSIPNAEQVLEAMPLPRAIDEAAICLFLSDDTTSRESEIIRAACARVRKTGTLGFQTTNTK